MIYRLITYRYRDETTREQVDELHRLMDDLDAALGDDVTVIYGPNKLPENNDQRREAYLVIAKDEDALLKHYRPHPLHEEMLARLDWLEEMAAADLHKP
jgi:hypothetical protein